MAGWRKKGEQGPFWLSQTKSGKNSSWFSLGKQDPDFTWVPRSLTFIRKWSPTSTLPSCFSVPLALFQLTFFSLFNMQIFKWKLSWKHVLLRTYCELYSLLWLAWFHSSFTTQLWDVDMHLIPILQMKIEAQSPNLHNYVAFLFFKALCFIEHVYL